MIRCDETLNKYRATKGLPMNKNPTPPSDEHEELVHGDDAVIGRAARWSLLALLSRVLIAGAAGYLAKRKPAGPPPKVTQLVAPVVPEESKADIPVTRFTEITRAAGVRFVHNNGAYGDKLLPETMGSGVAFFDYDNDGAPDLLFINSTYWPWKTPSNAKPSTMALYHNDGRGNFTEATAGSGLDVSFYGMGVAVGDFDNDGAVDVFVTG